MKFTLEITLGNAEMQTGFDVGAALERVANRLAFDDTLTGDEHGLIFDANGNRVGNWKVAEPPTEEELSRRAWRLLGDPAGEGRGWIGYQGHHEDVLKGLRDGISGGAL